MKSDHLIDLLRNAREMIRTGWNGRDCDEVDSIVGRIDAALSDLSRSYDHIRVLRSNCEHSNNGQFRVHLTEADFDLITGEVDRLKTGHEATQKVLSRVSDFLDGCVGCDTPSICFGTTKDIKAEVVGLIVDHTESSDES